MKVTARIRWSRNSLGLTLALALAFGCSYFGLHDAVALEDGSSDTESKGISVSEPLVVNAELAATPVLASPSMESRAASQRDSSVEGIDVHGHWTIEVRDPDGTLVERREFENALNLDGDDTIITILGRQRTPSMWVVFLYGSEQSEQPCLFETSTPIHCRVGEPASSDANQYKNLTLTVSEGDPSTLTLSGFAIAQRDGNVSTVATFLGTCLPGISPEVCGTTQISSQTGITTTTLSAPITVVTGQSIQVSVAITVS